MSDPTHNHAAKATDRDALAERVRSLRLPPEMAAGRAASGRLPWVLCLLLALTTAVFGYRAFTVGSGAKPADSTPSPGSAVPTVTGATASSGDVVLEAKGYIIPAHQIQVSPKVGGMVMKLNIEEGLRVKKGDVLAELEKVDYQADADRAQATLEAAKQRLLELERGNRPEEIKQTEMELAEATASLKQLRSDWQRNQKLQGGGALATRDYEQAWGAYESQERRVRRLEHAFDLMKKGPRDERKDAARAEVQQAEADLTKALWRLDNCTVRAPVTGTILTKKAEEGNVVNPAAFNISATLCDMADLSDLEVELTIQERDIANVVVGQNCRIVPEAFQNNKIFLERHPRGYTGKVSRLMPIADRSKGAIPVRVKLLDIPREEEGVYLKPDMSAIVSFLKVDE